ncbi:MAG TPA: polymer-forming cytoskeletal protein [Acidimicrobiia bacterium]|jgi:cytoskeletal protein CcmA (bactofilin family)
MPYLSRRLVLTILAGGLLVAAAATPVVAAETSNSEFVIIQGDDVFPDDLYAGAVRVVVEGTLDGDLVAFAGEEVVIDGTVTGSVLAVAPRVTVNGLVEGNLRVSANDFAVSGTVNGDVVAAVVDATLWPTSVIGGDALLWAWSADALGTIAQDLNGSQKNLQLAGTVEGDVDVSVSRLNVVDSLTVGGDLGYRSKNDIEGLEMAGVEGAVVAKTPLPPNVRIRALTVLGRFLIVLFLSVAALLAALGWPRRTQQAINNVGKRPIRNWLLGALVIFSPLLMIVVTGLILVLAPAAAAFPLLAVLVPVILTLVGIALAVSFVAGAPAVGWLGGVLLRRLDLYGSVLAGSIVVGVVWYLPFVGFLVPLLVLPIGLGAWISAWRDQATASAAA